MSEQEEQMEATARKIEADTKRKVKEALSAAPCPPLEPLEVFLRTMEEETGKPRQPPAKPCPFCKESQAVNLRADGPGTRYVVCQNCKATGPKFETFMEAVISWNAATPKNRHAMSEQEEQMEATARKIEADTKRKVKEALSAAPCSAGLESPPTGKDLADLIFRLAELAAELEENDKERMALPITWNPEQEPHRSNYDRGNAIAGEIMSGERKILNALYNDPSLLEPHGQLVLSGVLTKKLRARVEHLSNAIRSFCTDIERTGTDLCPYGHELVDCLFAQLSEPNAQHDAAR